MNMKEYESAMESYDSDDIVLGDIDHNNEAHESDMDILLEALDMLPEAEFTAAMESMTDDEIYAICVALEASHGGSDDALGAADDYKEKIAGGRGGLGGKLYDYLAKKGTSSLTSDMINKITKTGEAGGKQDLANMAWIKRRDGSDYSRDSALNTIKADQKARNRKMIGDLWRNGVRNPMALIAAHKKLNDTAAKSYKEAADKKIEQNRQRAADKKAKEDFLKAHPEQAASVKLEENRKKEDQRFDNLRKTLSDDEKAIFDRDFTNPRNKNRGREDALANRKEMYDNLIKAGLSEKEARKRVGGDEDKLKRRFDTLDNRERLKGGFKEGFDALGQTAGARAAKKVGGAIKGGAKEMWKRLTASTGEEIGFDCYNGDDIDIAIESVYESGDTIYTSALEEAYYAARIIESMDDTEIDELMSEMSATESIEFMTCLNYLSDVIDSDIQRDNRIAFESAIESAFSDDESGYAVAYEDSTAPPVTPPKQAQQQTQTQAQPAQTPAKPAAAPQQQTQTQAQSAPAPAPAQAQQQSAPAPAPAPQPKPAPTPAPAQPQADSKPAPAPAPTSQQQQPAQPASNAPASNPPAKKEETAPAAKKDSNPTTTPAEKPSLGTRIKNFFTGKGYNESSGLKQRMSDAFKSARTKISNWWNGKKSDDSNNSGDKTEKAADSKDG